jgi:hypothetical protein
MKFEFNVRQKEQGGCWEINDWSMLLKCKGILSIKGWIKNLLLTCKIVVITP